MEDRPSKPKKKSLDIWIIGAVIILFLVFVIVFFILSQDNVKTTGDWPERETVDAISCEKENSAYPFFEYDNSTKKVLKVNATFKNNTLEAISLQYILYYETLQQITDSENLNHVAMSKSFDENGLEFDALGSQYSKAQDLLQFSLYAEANKINSGSSKYFLLNLSNKDPYTRENIRQNYRNQGFSCTTKDN